MNFPEQLTRRQLLARWLAGASTLLFALFQFVPWGAYTTDQALEDSWIQVQHLAFLQHLQFGRDIVFSFGPWGFLLYGGYYPTTYPITLIVLLPLSVVFWWAAWRIAHSIFENEFISWFWIMIFTATARLGGAWVLLLLLAHFFAEDRPFTIIQALLAVSLSLLSLTQFIVFILSVMAVAAIVFDNIVRQRRFPWILPLFAAGLLCFWMAAGQHVSNLGLFIRYSWQITSGYTEAMMLTGSNQAQDIACFLVLGIVVSVIIGYTAWLRNGFFGLIPCAGVCFILFTDFKYGYVRHDGHDLWAVRDLLLVSLASVAVLWPVARKKGQWVVVASLLPTAAIFLFLSFTYSHDAQTGLLAGIPKTSGMRGIFAPIELFSGNNPLRDAYEKHLAQLRDLFPLPHIEGNIDAYTWNLDPVFAHGLSYHPRPVIQSYSAYTPELTQLNADFLRGENAPENILIEGSTLTGFFPPTEDGLTTEVDDRFPSLDDGLSWPELLTRYDVQEAEVSFVLLKHSLRTRQFRLVPLEDISVNFGERIALPSTTNGPIWAEIELNHTLLGMVVSALYKPPILLLDGSTRGGQQEFQKRLVPGMARSGFLLSPLVEGCASFATLASTEASGDLSDNEVASLMITTADGTSASSYYQSPVQLHFYRLEYPKQNLENVTGFKQLTQLEKVLSHARLLRAESLPQMVYSSDEKTVLKVPESSEMLFATPKDAKRLKIGFGIHEWNKMPAEDTNGITFQALALNKQGQPVPLWSRRLEPVARKADQGKQEAVVTLSGLEASGIVLVSGIVLETLPAEKNSGHGQYCYWSEIDFE